MICAECASKIADHSPSRLVFLRGGAEVATVCITCYEDQEIPMQDVVYCERCEAALNEDFVYYANEELCDDAPYIDSPLCQACYGAVVDEYGVENGPDEPPEPPMPVRTSPSGAEKPPDPDFQMDA